MLEMADIKKGVEMVANNYPIKRVSLFGSYAEQRQTDDSDIDFLIEFTSNSVSLFTLSSVKYALEDALGISVDVLHAPLPADAMITPNKLVNVYEQ